MSARKCETCWGILAAGEGPSHAEHTDCVSQVRRRLGDIRNALRAPAADLDACLATLAYGSRVRRAGVRSRDEAALILGMRKAVLDLADLADKLDHLKAEAEGGA